jgi:hypothetical protein
MGMTPQVFFALVGFGLTDDTHQAMTIKVANQVATQKFTGNLDGGTVIEFTH